MMRDTVREVFDSNESERFMYPVVDCLFIQPKIGRTECNILFDSWGKDLIVGILEDNTNKLAHLADIVFGDGFTANQNRTGCWFENAVKTFEERALSGTV
jgi:hypothetical protein